MAHDGRIRFGLFSPLSGLTFDSLMARAGLLERLGYHSIWLDDHMWTRGVPEIDHLDCVPALAAVAARTERLRLGTLVICNAYRNPAMLAKSLCAVDQISKGRLDVGLGIGWMKEEFTAYGFEYPKVGVRLKQLEESLQILKAMFTEPKATFKGRYYSVTDAYNNPKPVQKPHPPITIGGAGKKVMLRIIAKYADRWNIPGGYPDIADLTATLKGHCEAVGRDFNQIEISEQLLVCLGASAEEVERKWQAASRMRPFATTAIKGTPPELVAALKDRIAKGVRTFIVFFSDGSAPQTIETFAKEVMPAFA
ncbi:MAG: LLM class flavin-dependent oxidoreductase [Candidatus Binataceae bacterium]